jgi:O-antigen/teichoic acid export membrane protein
MPPSGSPSKLAKDSLRTFAASLITAGVGIATGIVIAKSLGPLGKGTYSSVQVMMALVMSLTGGGGAAITYALTKGGRHVSEILPALGVLGAIICGLTWMGLAVWSLFHSMSLAELVFATMVPAAIVLSWQGPFFIGVGRLRQLNFRTTGLAISTLVAVLLTVGVFHAHIVGALLAWAACVYVVALMGIVSALNLAHGPTSSIVKTVRFLTSFGAQNALNAFLGSLNYRIDFLIVIGSLGTAASGVYSIAIAVGELMFMITRPVSMAISRDAGTRDLASSAAMTARVIRTLTAVVLAASIVIFFAGPPLIDVVYGMRFHGAALPLRLLLPGIVAFSTAGTFAIFFVFQLGRPAIVTYTNIVMIIVQAIACLLLVPRIGLAGAAIASAATYVVGALANTWWFCSATAIRPRDVWLVRREDIKMIYNVAFGRTKLLAAADRA